MTHEEANVHPLSWTAALVLQALTQGHAYGFDIMATTRLASGTVYPLLRRLEGSGLVTSAWEEEEAAREDGRPARRYYALTPSGSEALAAARERLAAQQAVFGDSLAGAGGG